MNVGMDKVDVVVKVKGDRVLPCSNCIRVSGLVVVDVELGIQHSFCFADRNPEFDPVAIVFDISLDHPGRIESTQDRLRNVTSGLQEVFHIFSRHVLTIELMTGC
jgi:hypothetical protein